MKSLKIILRVDDDVPGACGQVDVVRRRTTEVERDVDFRLAGRRVLVTERDDLVCATPRGCAGKAGVAVIG